jgi:ATP phosphoribosyltransferase regulatory subunit HisZ
MRISRPLYWELLASNALKYVVNQEDIRFVTNKINGQVQTSTKNRTNLIELDRRSHFINYPEYYRNEAEIGIQRGNLFQTNPELEQLWNSSKDIYDLYSVLSKEDLYEDGIAYKFTTHLGRMFREKYSKLESAASDLQLLDIEAYDQLLNVYSDEYIYIILTGNSTKDVHKLQFELISKPTHGTLSALIDRNTIRYTPDRIYAGEDSFKFIVSDGIVDSEPAQVTIQVVKKIVG